MSNKNTMTTNHRKEYGFLWSMVILSLLTVILLFAYSFFFLTPAYTDLIAQNTEETAILVGEHIKTSIFPDGRTFARETLPQDLNSEIAEFIHAFNLMKIKVFAPSGETIFSTDIKDIGVINEYEYFQQVVAKGRPFTQIVHKDRLSLEGQKVVADVVETYVPVKGADGAFLGAFEIYFDITGFRARLDRLVTQSNRLLYAASAALFLLMLFVALRARANILARWQAEAKILEQRKVLAESNKDLSIINAISEVISHFIDMDRLLAGVLDAMTHHFLIFNNKGGIFLLSGDRLILTALLDHDDEFLSLHENITINDCLCGQAARTGEVVFSESSTFDANHTLCAHLDKDHGHVIIPLMAQDAVEGVLFLYTEAGVHVSDKRNLLQGIGRQIGLAINNAKLYQQTKELALYDQLTGLPNRRFMVTRLEEVLNTAERYDHPFSVAMIDIDFFKKYNDTMGHAAGDRILADAGNLIRQQIREVDFVARYGGEEFIAILEETDQRNAYTGLERIRSSIEKRTGVTVSIGVTAYRPGLDLTQLLKEADDALYLAKANGRNRVEWSDACPRPGYETPV